MRGLQQAAEYWDAAFSLAREIQDIEYLRFAQAGKLATLVLLYAVDAPQVAALRERNLAELPWAGPVNEYSTAEVATAEAACRLREGRLRRCTDRH